MKLIAGQLIHRRYRLDSRLAQGGMGEVWKGYDIQLGREVAIKALRSDVTNAEAKLRRLRAEAHNSANRTSLRCSNTTSMTASAF